MKMSKNLIKLLTQDQNCWDVDQMNWNLDNIISE